MENRLDSKGVMKAYIISNYDLYPIDAYGGTPIERGFSRWVVTVAAMQAIITDISTAMMSDPRELRAHLGDVGVYFDSDEIVKVGRFMSAYLRELRKRQNMNEQIDHLGWVSEQDKRFVLYERLIAADGSVTKCNISRIATIVKESMGRAGTLQRQIELLDFYNQPEYIPHQVMILASIGTPMFYATGQAGVIVNLAGETGGSKSTAGYTAAGIWGHPDRYVINGNKAGGTTLSRVERIATLPNLPVIIDEITKMDREEAEAMALNVSQPDLNRGRIDKNGVPRAPRSGYKSMMMLCTTNKSLYEIISANNTAGQASTMRVFEMNIDKFKPPHSKVQADEYLRELRQNYGHIGEYFMINAIQVRPQFEARIHKKMAELDVRLDMQGSERHWSAVLAAVLVNGDFAYRLGLHKFDLAAIESWFCDVLFPRLRGHISTELDRRTPDAVLGDFLDFINGKIIRVSKDPHSASAGWDKSIFGELDAHIDVDAHEIWIRWDSWRRYCERNNHQSNALVDELITKGAVTRKMERRTLGLGTIYEKARSRVFVVDMNHPLVKMPAAPPAALSAPIAPAGMANNVVQLPRSGRK